GSRRIRRSSLFCVWSCFMITVKPIPPYPISRLSPFPTASCLICHHAALLRQTMLVGIWRQKCLAALWSRCLVVDEQTRDGRAEPQHKTQLQGRAERPPQWPIPIDTGGKTTKKQWSTKWATPSRAICV